MKGDAFRAAPDINTAEDLIGAAQRQAQGLLAEGRSIRTVVDLESPALVGRFDFTHALRILGNLLENALRYTPPAGSVELGVRRDGDALVFTVADRGPGIPAAETDRIFQAFYRHADAAPDVGRAEGSSRPGSDSKASAGRPGGPPPGCAMHCMAHVGAAHASHCL